MSKAKNWKIAFFVLGVLVLAFMIYSTGLNTIWDNVQKTGLWFIPVIGIWIVVYILNTLACQVIVRDKYTPRENYPSFLKMLKITISGYTINYITPVVALGGEPYRILELQEYVGGKKATSSVLSYSLMHILSHVVFWMGSIILIIILLSPGVGLIIGCAVVFAIFALFLYLIFRGYRNGLIVKLFNFLGRIPLIKKPVKKFAATRGDIFEEIDQNIVMLYAERRGTFYLSLSLEVLARLIACFELFFIGRSIGMDMDLIDSIVLYAGSTLISNILFFFPMQLGSREGGLLFTLTKLGFAASNGVYIALIVRIRELVWIAIGLILMRIRK